MNLARFETPAGRPLWLTTLADLALLLVGFFVLLQATQSLDRGALARGLRAGFDAPEPPAPPPMAIEGARISGFASGSAVLPADARTVVEWVRGGARDARVAVRIAGATAAQGDLDPASGSAAVLAADRARAVAVALVAAGAARPTQIVIADATTGMRGATLELGFAGERQATAARQPLASRR